jgi:hypothetical protein
MLSLMAEDGLSLSYAKLSKQTELSDLSSAKGIVM